LGSVTPSTASAPEAPAHENPAGSAAPGGAETTITPSAADSAEPARHNLIARAHEPTWLSVRSDRGERRQVLLQPGQTARFGAEERLLVTMGNAGGVTLWFNGTPLTVQGRSGEVIRDLVLPPPQGSPSVGTKAAAAGPQR
jgi:cytoskeleton protein RodZ